LDNEIVERRSSPRDYGLAPPEYRLPDATHVGRVRLQIADLERSSSYYRNVLGLFEQTADGVTASFGARDLATTLVELHAKPEARPIPRKGRLGLYHFAILLPTREDLGRFVRHLQKMGLDFGSADHFVSESIYLWDPDGLGIEVYADRPRTAWRTNGPELVLTTELLDVRSLAAAGGSESWDGMPRGTTMGHIHLSVGDLAVARSFFHNGLGFDAVVWNYPGALFLSAGGYHHHLGTNTWAAGAPLATDADARLLEWQLVLPDVEEVRRAALSVSTTGHDVSESGDDRIAIDPWGTPLRLTASGC
jgi:catechol 2,3-dioxygenase